VKGPAPTGNESHFQTQKSGPIIRKGGSKKRTPLKKRVLHRVSLVRRSGVELGKSRKKKILLRKTTEGSATSDLTGFPKVETRGGKEKVLVGELTAIGDMEIGEKRPLAYEQEGRRYP